MKNFIRLIEINYLMARFLVIALSLVLMGCGGGQKITDYSKRSIVYSWIDVSDIPGNKLVMYEMRNLSAAQSEKFYGMGYEKVGNGFWSGTMVSHPVAMNFIVCRQWPALARFARIRSMNMVSALTALVR